MSSIKEISLKRNLYCCIIALLIGLLQSQECYVNALGCVFPSTLNEWCIVILYVINYSIPLFFLLSFFTRDDIRTNNLTDTMSNKEFWCCVLFFCVVRIPYLYVFYPGTHTGDTSRQVSMFFHLPSVVAGKIAIDGQKCFLNAHYSVLFSFIFGSFYKLGMIIGNIRIGILVYSVMQILVASYMFATAIKIVSNSRVKKIIILGLIAWIAVMPNISLFTICMITDVPFSILILSFCIMMYQICLSRGDVIKEKKFIIQYFLIILLICMTKKTGIYICTLSLISLAIIYKNYKKQFMVCIFILLLCFSVLYEGVLYKVLNVKESGLQEALSLPFQQTAYFLRNYDGVVSTHELSVIDNILDSEKIINEYDPDYSESVKNTFNENASKKELLAYFGVYLQELVKEPKLYLDAFITGTYRYTCLKPKSMYNGMFGFYEITSVKTTMRFSGVFDYFDIKEEDIEPFNVESPESHAWLRAKAKGIVDYFSGLPFLGVLVSVGFYSCVLMILACVCIWKKEMYKLVPFIPMLFVFVSCILSPVNGSDRYSLPMVFCLPFLFGITFGNGFFEVKGGAKNICDE